MCHADSKVSDSYSGRNYVARLAPNRLVRNLLLAGILCILIITLLEWNPFREREGLLDWRPSDNIVPLDTPLRLLPLGDSITEGFRSSDGNGYRLHLLNLLATNGYRVKYIGSLSSGNMSNNKNDGFGGRSIDGIASGTRKTLAAERPNVVLLHAGTNDMNDDPPREPYDTAPDRLGNLVDEILRIVPRTTIIVAQIVQSTYPKTRDRISTYNAILPDIVAKRSDEGARVLMVDMSSIGADGTTTADGLHPNDNGYAIMANFWFLGLQTAIERHWISDPM
ncbi:carbohydrate esterase family 3 protein [Acidomyces richmondensis BFW]|nr:MAG: carbohydrate esterase family 3 protein [Acidomyces sp. 'richmondensis']KYG50106.1 carbohydrate esterase family 3 protein [Acidomyces richmondensis BFW]